MSRRCLLQLFFAGVFFAGSALAANELPLFDAHIHYNADAQATYPPEEIIGILNRAGVERALVSSTPNDGTISLHRKYPTRVVAELRPYRQQGDSGSWHRDPDVIPFLEQELARGIYRAIGEFHLHSGQTDTAVVKRVVALAQERDIPLHAHSDDGAIRELFSIDSKVKVLWAHAGMSAQPEKIRSLLERYSTLWVELSLRSYDVAPGGRLDPKWRELFLRFPDRFLVGSDTWTTSRWEAVESENRIVRAWLGQLPRDVAEKIAFRNIARLFPRE